MWPKRPQKPNTDLNVPTIDIPMWVKCPRMDDKRHTSSHQGRNQTGTELNSKFRTLTKLTIGTQVCMLSPSLAVWGRFRVCRNTQLTHHMNLVDFNLEQLKTNILINMFHISIINVVREKNMGVVYTCLLSNVFN